jgi:prepilin-type processing-associated H-X9-DG protein
MFCKGSGDTGELFDFYRHYGNMNVLFCDGHGETVALPAQFLMPTTDKHKTQSLLQQCGALQNISVTVGFPQ